MVPRNCPLIPEKTNVFNLVKNHFILFRSVLDYSIAINQLDEKDKTSMVLTGLFMVLTGLLFKL
jgi:hypothetical protein